jgi:hypothetical protein
MHYIRMNIALWRENRKIGFMRARQYICVDIACVVIGRLKLSIQPTQIGFRPIVTSVLREADQTGLRRGEIKCLLKR